MNTIPKWNRWIRVQAAWAVLLAAPALAATHPSILYGAQDLPAIQQRAAGPQKALFDSLKAGAGYFVGSDITSSGVVVWPSQGKSFNLGDKRDVGNSLIVFSFVAAVSGDPAYFALAHRWLMDAVHFGNLDIDGTADLTQATLLIGVALSYDMLAPQLSASEVQQIQAVLSRNADALMNAGKGGMWWEPEVAQNHNWINHDSIGYAALALRGEVAQSSTDAWLKYASDNAARVKAVLDRTTDGTWHEGLAYGAYGLSLHLPFLTALKRAGGPDLTDLQALRAYGQMRAHIAVPDRASQYVLAYGDFYSFASDEGLEALRWAASTYGDTVAQAEADAWAAGIQRNKYGPELQQAVFELVFTNPGVPSATLASQPLDWYGSDLQAAVFRSGWDANATVFALKDGPFGGEGNFAQIASGKATALNFGHDHADDNGFYLYGNGAWLAPEAEGYFIGHADSPGPAANATWFHNSLVVDGVGQLGGGVRGNGDESQRYGWFNARKGGIPFVASTAHSAYAIGEGAQLYPSSLGLTRWDRHVLFLDRKWVLLRDVIEASASHVYSWTCHFMNGASREGSWIHGVADNGQALGVAVVAPASFNAGFAPQAPVHVDHFNPNGYVVSAQVSPSAPAANATFLTALIPVANANWSSRPQVAPLDPAQPDGALTVTDGAHRAVALFNSAATGTRQAAGYSLSGEAGVAEYDSNAPARAVLVNGTSLADPHGTLISQGGAAAMLEADGLSGTTVALSGDTTQKPRIWAPNAAKVTANGADAPFTRDGEYIQLGAVATSSSGTLTTAGSDLGGGGGGGGSGAPAAKAGGCSTSGAGIGLAGLFGIAALALRRRRALRPAPEVAIAGLAAAERCDSRPAACRTIR